jgi:putative redox protein
MTSTVIYEGGLRTRATHLRSGTEIETDAPIDNQGKGERFSPSDLVATALASCMATIMGIAARNREISIDGTKLDVEKIMTGQPRRIGEVRVDVWFPEHAAAFDDKLKAVLEHAALTCPVYLSLHPEIRKTVTFHWP